MAWLIRGWTTISISPLRQGKLPTVKMIYSAIKIKLLSHILTSDKFQEAVAQLRNLFTGEGHTETLYKPAYHKRTPADGVTYCMEGIRVRYLPTFLTIY
jgi:hypothetical protein